MAVTANQVKELREKTGAGMMDCKNALNEAKGDMEQAIVVLRKKGLASAQKKATRIAAEGMIGHYIHAGGKLVASIAEKDVCDAKSRCRVPNNMAKGLIANEVPVTRVDLFETDNIDEQQRKR